MHGSISTCHDIEVVEIELFEFYQRTSSLTRFSLSKSSGSYITYGQKFKIWSMASFYVWTHLTVRFLFSDTNQVRQIQGGNILLMLSRNNLEDLWQAVRIISWWRVNLRYRTLIPIKSIIFMFKSFWFLRIFLYICSMSMDHILYLWCTYRCSEVYSLIFECRAARKVALCMITPNGRWYDKIKIYQINIVIWPCTFDFVAILIKISS